MSQKYRCNPMNIEYKYQFFKVQPEQDDLCEIHREAADPSLICFKGKYYMFPSMSGGFYISEAESLYWDSTVLSAYLVDLLTYCPIILQG